MIYKVRAKYQEDKLQQFFNKLTDGTIINQKPDGAEIVSSMKRAKITSPGIIEWYETCYCPAPLQHERETVYDQFLTDITTHKANEYGYIEGESFWDYLERR